MTSDEKKIAAVTHAITGEFSVGQRVRVMCSHSSFNYESGEIVDISKDHFSRRPYARLRLDHERDNGGELLPWYAFDNLEPL